MSYPAEVQIVALAVQNVDRKELPHIDRADFQSAELGNAYSACLAQQDKQWNDFDLSAPRQALSDPTWQMVSDALTDLMPFQYPKASHLAANIVDDAITSRINSDLHDAMRRSGGQDLVAEISSIATKHARVDSKEFQTLQDILLKVDDQTRRAAAGQQIVRSYATYISAMDGALSYGGLPFGKVTTIGATTGGGKSALAKTIALNGAANGNGALIGTFEDDAESTVLRLLSPAAQIENYKLQRYMIDKDSYDRIQAASSKIYNYPIELVDSAKNIDDICSKFKSRIAQDPSKFGLAIFDFLQIIPGGRGAKQEQVDYTFSRIVDFARWFSTGATLCISQLRRRESPNQRPTRFDLYHSGSIEQHSHTIILIWRPFPAMPFATAIIDKQKQGSPADVTLRWHPEYTHYSDPVDSKDYDDMVCSL